MSNYKIIAPLLLACCSASAAVVHIPGPLPGPIVEDFNGSLAFPDTVLPLAQGIQAGAHFAGQTAGITGSPPGGPWETIAGAPPSFLTLVAQPTDASGFQNVLLSGGPNGDIAGYLNSMSTGSLAFLFPRGMLAFGVDIKFANTTPSSNDPGPVTFEFFDGAGSSIGSFSFTAVDMAHAFESDSANIRGVLITNQDPLGLAFDNLRLIPSPATLMLLAVGLVGRGLSRR